VDEKATSRSELFQLQIFEKHCKTMQSVKHTLSGINADGHEHYCMQQLTCQEERLVLYQQSFLSVVLK
jgi:hypothetical protein